MSDAKYMGDYFRRIIQTIQENLESLEKEKIKYGRFKNYVKATNKNIKERQKDLKYYVNLLNEYKKAGYAE